MKIEGGSAQLNDVAPNTTWPAQSCRPCRLLEPLPEPALPELWPSRETRCPAAPARRQHQHTRSVIHLPVELRHAGHGFKRHPDSERHRAHAGSHAKSVHHVAIRINKFNRLRATSGLRQSITLGRRHNRWGHTTHYRRSQRTESRIAGRNGLLAGAPVPNSATALRSCPSAPNNAMAGT